MTGQIFTSAQIAALDALASGASFQDAAAAAGVTSRTLRRWRVERLFSQAVQQARRAAREETAAAVRGLVPRAVAVIDEVLSDETAPATVRLKAAEVVLRRALDEPGAHEPLVAVREPCSDPVTASVKRALGEEPTEAVIWPTPEVETATG